MVEQLPHGTTPHSNLQSRTDGVWTLSFLSQIGRRVQFGTIDNCQLDVVVDPS